MRINIHFLKRKPTSSLPVRPPLNTRIKILPQHSTGSEIAINYDISWLQADPLERSDLGLVQQLPLFTVEAAASRGS